MKSNVWDKRKRLEAEEQAAAAAGTVPALGGAR